MLSILQGLRMQYAVVEDGDPQTDIDTADTHSLSLRLSVVSHQVVLFFHL